MRLLTLHFANLNALNGKWTIDFTAPEYTSDGIFAISGPTGSGKTTLLDAICLALYGRTPRLANISTGQNDIMSRHKYECWSEVEFEINHTTYRVRWSQKRAKKSGKLQAIQHILYDKNGRAISEKVSETAIQINTLIGLDFTQFTRTVLLAQGSFAAFLQAPPAERAQILEKITGTEIYGKISQEIHRLTQIEHHTLNQLNNQVQNLQLLTLDEEQQIYHDISKLDQEIKQQEHILAQQKQQWHLCKQYRQLQQQQQQLQHDLEQYTQQKQDFDSKYKQIARAEAAMQLLPLHQQIQQYRQKQQQFIQNTECNQKDLTQYKQDYQNIEYKQQQQSSIVQQHYSQLNALRALIPQVRAFDQSILLKNKILNDKQNAIYHNFQQQVQHEQQIQQLKDQLHHAKNDLKKIQIFLEQYQCSHQLDIQLPLLEQKINDLKKISNEKNELQQEIQHYENVISHLQRQKLSDALHLSRQLLKKEQDNYRLLQNQLNEFPEDLDDQWRIYQRYHFIQKQYIQYKQDIENTQHTIDNQQQKLTQIQAELNALQPQLDQAQTQFQIAQQQDQLSQKIIQLSELRQQLHDGEPCPLCGSCEHPYIDELSDLHYHAHSQLQQCSQLFNSLTAQQRQAQSEQKAALNLLQYYQHHLSEQTHYLHDLEQQLNHIPQTINIETQLQQLESKKESFAQLTKQKNNIHNILSELENQFQNAQEAFNQCELQYQTTQTLIESKQQQLIKLSDQFEFLKQQWQRQLHIFLPQHSGNLAHADSALEQLSQKLKQFHTYTDQNQELKQYILLTNQEIIQSQQQLHQLHETQEHTQQEINTLQHELEHLNQQRFELFKEDNIDIAEQNAQKMTDHATQTLQQIDDQLHEIRTSIFKIENNLENNQMHLQETIATLAQLDTQFDAALQENTFLDEHDFINALLSEKVLTQLKIQQNELQQKYLDLHYAITQNEQAQYKLKQELNDIPPEHNIEQIMLAQEHNVKQLHHSMGRLQEQIDHQNKLKNNQQQLLQLVQKQQIEYRRWQKLDSLIGSANGNVYRNFAQSLTFDVLMRYANQQLHKINQRYLLTGGKPDTNKTKSLPQLDIFVIDNWQGGEQRTGKNLSGGESFLVSLALALGLAQINGQHLHIDSFFLDEGFGTLDADTLETVLDALSELRNDGKLIGIISHIPALTERIATQIHVHSHTGGRSTLSGAGITQG